MTIWSEEAAVMGLPETEKETLRDLARQVSRHRRGGGELDSLPVRQQDVLQRMGEAERQVFMEELSRADAEQGRKEFHAALSQWRPQKGEPDPEGVP
ncbi:hypothetical protein J8J14_22650 [Roseomonas sp. SSH11]|uniref:Uncharacterized protein n=1 Tax=Pararoseomonas baculiformis TaxID=2820812 RepID=A0ABS4AM24_9PROT|nr:hypothetical protein [Pararoseomonas baculiformis]MBP0447563.1 hypothetical protein [Pararoseomonas baculiformis]